MNESKVYNTLKLTWEQVAWYLENILSGFLGRPIQCTCQAEDNSYWSVAATNDRFSYAEIERLLSYVRAAGKIGRGSLPVDAPDSRSLDMELARMLLQQVLHTTWEEECITDKALWLIGIQMDALSLPDTDQDLFFLGDLSIDCSKLWGKEEFVQYLFDEGGTFTQLADLCDRYVHEFHNELYWHFPISDGDFNGVYFVLVKEGILCLPYNVIDCEDHECFESQGVRLCTAEDLGFFIHDWNRTDTELRNAMSAFYQFLTRKEHAQGADF